MLRVKKQIGFAVISLGLATLYGSSVLAQPIDRANITFSQLQAESGKGAYDQHCSVCHGSNLEGIGFAPQLLGERFNEQWKDRSAAILASYIRGMPMAPIGESGR